MMIEFRSHFGLEEFGEEVVYAEKPAACQRDRVIVTIEQTLLAQPLKNGLKFVPDIDDEFLAKVSLIKDASLELKDHFSNELLFQRQWQRAEDWQLTGIQEANVLFNAVRILEMHAAEMRERRDSESDHVPAVP